MGDKPTIRETIQSAAAAAETKKALLQWVQYRMDEGDKFRRSQIEALITTAEAAESEYGKLAVVAIICDCIISGNKYLFWDRITRFPKLEATREEATEMDREANCEDKKRMEHMFDKLSTGGNANGI